MDIIKLIVGIIILAITVVSVFWSIARTPDSLCGYYGLMYGVISLGGLIGGISLILTSGII